jgi:Clostripain family
MNDWLVMLFLGGDSDLIPFGQLLLDEAAQVGSSDRVAVVAEIEPTTPDEQTLRGPILPGVRDMQRIGVTNVNMRPETIIEFVDASKATYEARNRMLILWDHGNGWQNVHVFENVVTATNIVKQKEESETTDGAPLFINDLRAVLDEKRDIAVVGFDACLMSMIEIAFQLRDTAQFMVASQHLQPAARGWPYEALLRSLTFSPRMEPEELVRTMVDTFAGSYNGAGDAVTLSGLRLSAEVDRAVAAIDSFSLSLLDAIHDSDHNTNGSLRGDIIMARRHTQSFGNPDYIDIVSFCEQIQKWLPNEPKVNRSADLVKRAIARLVVRHTRSGSASVGHANGVSIYFPNTHLASKVAEEYAKLDFANALYCRWAMFLKVIVEGLSTHEAKKLFTTDPKSDPPKPKRRKKASSPRTKLPNAPSPSPQLIH